MDQDLYTKSDEWQERHDNIVSWEMMWHRLSILFNIVAIVIALFIHHLLGWLFFQGGALLFLAAQIRCLRRHIKLHEEVDD